MFVEICVSLYTNMATYSWLNLLPNGWAKRSLFPVNSVLGFDNELTFYRTFYVNRHMAGETLLHMSGSYSRLFAYCCYCELEREDWGGKDVNSCSVRPCYRVLSTAIVQTVMYAQLGAFYNKTGAEELFEVRSSGLEIACSRSH
jgi:hypothetical protein